jgi:imidazoleglycerol-phosphate dehydratase
MERQSKIDRKTKETDITLELKIDGKGYNDIHTGIGFLDHMLIQIAKHGFFDISIKASGDLDVDCHHTVEDIGIVLGKCINQALGSKEGIKRYGSAIVPMDEALVLCALDISGRPLYVSDAKFSVDRLGNFDTEMFEEFFRALCINSGINLHIKVLEGSNNHHIAEAMFKAFGRALDEATQIDPRIEGVLSTKGMLEG